MAAAAAPGMSPPVHTGRGRRRIDPVDHLTTPGEYDDSWTTLVRGRKHIECEDHLKQGMSFVLSSREQTASHEVKECIRDLLVNIHSLIVFDEGRWARAGLEKTAGTWKITAMNEQMKTLGRENTTPKGLAEILSLMSVAELRHFGLRFGPAANSKAVAVANGTFHPPSPRGLQLGMDDNPTYVSPGVHTALGKEPERVQNYAGMSHTRRDPEDMSKRYIRSGKDHWDAFEVASHGTAGDCKDVSFAEGIERCIGHGRRHIPATDHIGGAMDAPEDVAHEGRRHTYERDHFRGVAVCASMKMES